MSVPAGALIAVSVWMVTGHPKRAAVVGVGVVAPGPVLAAGAGGLLMVATRRLRRSRLSRTAASSDVMLLAELAGLGISAGLSLSNALSAAQRFVRPDLAAEVAAILRRAARGGLAAALAESVGWGHRFYLICARAVTTGAPLGAAIDAFVAELRADDRAARLEAARRLPVRLMIPLALLILPGFVLLTVGPAVLAALERFALPR